MGGGLGRHFKECATNVPMLPRPSIWTRRVRSCSSSGSDSSESASGFESKVGGSSEDLGEGGSSHQDRGAVMVLNARQV